MVADRKYTSSPLNFRLRSQVVQQLDHVLIIESVYRRIEKFRIPGNLPHEFAQIGRICDVAAAFAGDINLLPQLFIFFQ